MIINDWSSSIIRISFSWSASETKKRCTPRLLLAHCLKCLLTIPSSPSFRLCTAFDVSYYCFQMLWEVRLLSFALCENEILTLRLNVLCLLADVVCSYPGGRLRDRENFALLLACLFSDLSDRPVVPAWGLGLAQGGAVSFVYCLFHSIATTTSWLASYRY